MNDYEKLVEHLRKFGLRLYGKETSILQTAADAIEQLVTDIDAVRKERDAAVADIKKNWMCATCSKRIVGKEWLYCLHLLSVEAEDGSRTCLNYKWRGVQE